MLRQTRRAVVGALSAFVLFAPTAETACAWVLWVQDSRTAEKSTTETWETASASSTEVGCDAKLKDRVASWQQSMEDGTTKPPKDEEVLYKLIDGRTLSLYFFRKGASRDELALRTQTIHYVCLPDTVDPRGPKGGAR